MVIPSAKKSLRAAFFLALIGVSLLICGLTFLSGVSAMQMFHEKSLTIGQAQIKRSMSAQLASNTQLLAETMARNLRDPLYLYDFSRIRSMLLEVSESDSLAYVYLTDKEGKLVHDGTRNVARFGAPIASVLSEEIAYANEPQIDAGAGLVHVNQEVRAGGSTIGRLYIGMTDLVAQGQVEHFSEILSRDQKASYRELLVWLAISASLLFGLGLASAFWLSQRVLAPLYELGARSRRFADGQDNVNFKLDRSDEIGSLSLALDDMVNKLSASHKEVWRLAYTDVLTGLPNRRQFHERLDQIIESAETESRSFAMLFIDLDFFKQVNDAFGHDTGDQVLKIASEKLKSNLRAYFSENDELAHHKHILSRISGDEFVLILPILTIRDAHAFLKNMYDSFAQPLSVGVRNIRQTVSAGVTYFPHQGKTAKELMKNADIAMYEAKKNGRATHCEFNEILQSEFKRRALIKQTAPLAIAENQFFVEYQPIFEIESSHTVGAEALLRWQHPELGRLWPGSFIGVLDECRLTTDLALWALKAVCEDFRRNCFKRPDFTVSINITSRVFMDERFHEGLLALVKDYRVPQGLLCIEIVESNLESNMEFWRYQTQRWHDAGVKLWVDDFGGTSSSLNLLKELPVDTLKVSNQLVRDIENSSTKSVIQAIQSFAKSLDIRVVGVGVESQSQLALISQFGCEFAQGYGLSSPLDVDKLPTNFERASAIGE